MAVGLRGKRLLIPLFSCQPLWLKKIEDVMNRYDFEIQDKCGSFQIDLESCLSIADCR